MKLALAAILALLCVCLLLCFWLGVLWAMLGLSLAANVVLAVWLAGPYRLFALFGVAPAAKLSIFNRDEG